jgi:hemolysin III
MDKPFEYTIKEEVIHSITHGLGVFLGIITLTVLTVISIHQHSAWKMAGSIIFSSSVIVLYLASTLYHSLSRTRLNQLFKSLDHAAIYVLIAGSYTPFCLISIRGEWGWSLFGIVWGIALFGAAFKMFFAGRFDAISTAGYILMGWLAIIAIHPIYHAIQFDGFILLALGGLFYTFGVIFYAWEKLPFNHGIWHLFVLAGTLCHVFCITFYVISI